MVVTVDSSKSGEADAGRTMLESCSNASSRPQEAGRRVVSPDYVTAIRTRTRALSRLAHLRSGRQL